MRSASREEVKWNSLAGCVISAEGGPEDGFVVCVADDSSGLELALEFDTSIDIDVVIAVSWPKEHSVDIAAEWGAHIE